MNEEEYGRVYQQIIEKRNQLLEENKKLLNVGDRHKHGCNCNFLNGMSWIIERLPRPNNGNSKRNTA